MSTPYGKKAAIERLEALGKYKALLFQEGPSVIFRSGGNTVKYKQTSAGIELVEPQIAPTLLNKVVIVPPFLLIPETGGINLETTEVCTKLIEYFTGNYQPTDTEVFTVNYSVGTASVGNLEFTGPRQGYIEPVLYWQGMPVAHALGYQVLNIEYSAKEIGPLVTATYLSMETPFQELPPELEIFKNSTCVMVFGPMFTQQEDQMTQIES